MGIKHTKVSAITNSVDTTKVRPSDWNSDHTIDGDVDFQGFDILNCPNLGPTGPTGPTGPQGPPGTSTVYYLNVQDFGATGDGSTDDYAAIQSCFDAAFGPVSAPNGQANKALNRAVYFPPGRYLVNTTLLIRSLQAGYMFGDNQDTTAIFNPNGTCIATNGCSNSVFRGLQFGKGGDATHAAFVLDWDSTGPVAMTQNYFDSCGFSGNGSGLGIQIGSSGYMGSENIFVNCNWAVLDTGLRLDNFNALNNMIVGGSAILCNDYAFDSSQGSISYVANVSLALNGADFHAQTTQNQFIGGVRSESQNFYNNASSNAATVLAGIEHTGSGYFLGGSSSGTVLLLGCSSNGTLQAGTPITLGNQLIPFDPAHAFDRTNFGIVHGGAQLIDSYLSTDVFTNPKLYLGYHLHNIGATGAFNFTMPNSPVGYYITLTCLEPFNFGVFVNHDCYLGGTLGTNKTLLSNTPGSSVTLVRVRDDDLVVATAFTGTWAFF